MLYFAFIISLKAKCFNALIIIFVKMYNTKSLYY